MRLRSDDRLLPVLGFLRGARSLFGRARGFFRRRALGLLRGDHYFGLGCADRRFGLGDGLAGRRLRGRRGDGDAGVRIAGRMSRLHRGRFLIGHVVARRHVGASGSRRQAPENEQDNRDRFRQHCWNSLCRGVEQGAYPGKWPYFTALRRNAPRAGDSRCPPPMSRPVEGRREKCGGVDPTEGTFIALYRQFLGRVTMFRRTVIACVAVMALAAGRAEAVTVRDIIELSKAGLSDSVLVALIEVDRTVFTLDTPTLKQLRAAEVSDAVIIAMIRSGRSTPPPVAQPVVQAPAEPQVVVIDHHDPA